MMVGRTEKGFSVIEVVIVLVVLGLLVLLGWKAWELTQQPPAEQQTTTSETTTPESVPDVETDADLDKADSALDSTDTNDDESTQLESQTNF